MNLVCKPPIDGYMLSLTNEESFVVRAMTITFGDVMVSQSSYSGIRYKPRNVNYSKYGVRLLDRPLTTRN